MIVILVDFDHAILKVVQRRESLLNVSKNVVVVFRSKIEESNGEVQG